MCPWRVSAAETSEPVSLATMKYWGLGLGPLTSTGSDQVFPPSVERMEKPKSASVMGPQ